MVNWESETLYYWAIDSYFRASTSYGGSEINVLRLTGIPWPKARSADQFVCYYVLQHSWIYSRMIQKRKKNWMDFHPSLSSLGVPLERRRWHTITRSSDDHAIFIVYRTWVVCRAILLEGYVKNLTSPTGFLPLSIWLPVNRMLTCWEFTESRSAFAAVFHGYCV